MRKDGMSEIIFFFDTYALFEVIRGNPKYQEYRKTTGVTTLFNLAELNYGLKREISKEKADKITQNFSSLLVEVTTEDIEEAMSLRIQHRDFSIPDAVGYTVARRLGIKFLTGDNDFENFPEVEFVKK